MIKSDSVKQINKQIMDIQGKGISLTIAMEECAELIQAISKFKRNKGDIDNLIEEIGDVLICIDYLIQLFYLNDEYIDEVISDKVIKTLEKLKNNLEV